MGGLGPVTVIDSGTATARIAISDTAEPGPRTLTVVTGAEQVSLDEGFEVNEGIPTLVSVNPNSGAAGAKPIGRDHGEIHQFRTGR